MHTDRESRNRSVGLSIRQPWVELILSGRKTIEVRSWPTRYRGVLWLHAGKRVERTLCSELGLEPSSLPCGAYVGRCEIVDCFEFDAESWRSLSERHLNPGELPERAFGWLLKHPERISAVPQRGSLGLMGVPDSVTSTLGGIE